jgi:hypothetical protein
MLLRILVAGLAFAIWLIVPSLAATVEPNTDRRGGDYDSFPLKPVTNSIAGAPQVQCEARCRNDPQCKAWTLVKAGVQAPDAICWLKNTVPPARNDGCCVSGVPASGNMAAFEPNVDRPGYDITVGAPMADANGCKAACDKVWYCVAWTWVKQGVQGPNALCYVKHEIPDAVAADCCTSGVKMDAVR